MNQELMDKMYANRGNYVNEKGDVVEPSGDGYPIVAGPWPNRFPAAVQARCRCCNRIVGISPKGLAMHRETPEERPILCPRCFEELAALAAMSEQMPVN